MASVPPAGAGVRAAVLGVTGTAAVWLASDERRVSVEDRLGAAIAELFDQLADALARDLRIGLQQAMDLVLERIELDGRRGR
jgi:hypothetical protein